MARQDVVDYLRANLKNYPLEDLRRQLFDEGVPDDEFEACLAEARKPLPKPPRAKPNFKLRLAAAGVVLAAGSAAILLLKPSAPPAAGPAGPADAAGPSGESGFVGAHGWVVRLPKDYEGVSKFRDPARTDEIVHFCRRGTDPTNFLDEGLFGEMGIVRVEVSPSPFPANPAGLASLAAAVSRKTASRGEKFDIKTISIATLTGVQVNVQAPFPRVEAYLLGATDLYFFYAGQEDEIWRAIVLSLRDAHSEN